MIVYGFSSFSHLQRHTRVTQNATFEALARFQFGRLGAVIGVPLDAHELQIQIRLGVREFRDAHPEPNLDLQFVGVEGYAYP